MIEPVDLNQTLDRVIQPQTITCGLEVTGLEAMSLLQSGWAYVVVLNQREQPQGLFDSQSVLGWLTPNSSGNDYSAHSSKSLAELDLQPLPSIDHHTTIGKFIDRISQYHYSASIWALVNARGKYVGVVEVLPLMRQLVQQKTTGSEQSLQQLFRLIELLPLPLVVHNTKGKVLGMNQAWRDHLDLTLTKGDHLIGQDNLYQCCISSDGDKHTWQIETAPMTGELQGLRIAIAQDITPQEQLAEELSGQNADLIRLNRLKDEFLACISHELKTPLTSVIGIANLLSSKAIGDLNDRQSRYVNMIHHSGQHLTAIFDNIVDLAKAETGQLELNSEPISTQNLCEQSIQQAQRLNQQDSLIKGLNQIDGKPLELKIPLDIDPAVATLVADGVRVQQMLVNLLSNALKFTEATQQPQVGLTVRSWEGWIALTVWDRGIGIPEDRQNLIFQKFQQLENPMTRRFDGTGLGLVLTRHLARLHGGDVTFVSQEGVGSQFTILLPPTPPKSIDLSSTQVSAMPSRLVLIVETVPQDVDRLVTTLTAWGYRVVVARSGTEALEKARRLQPCLILLSPDLPMLSGGDVLALLKQDPTTTNIRAVMTVSSTDKEMPQADGILLKPFQDSDLSAVLANYAPKTLPLTLLYIGKDADEEVIEQLQGLGHRLLHADDADDAETIAKIWHPDLILLKCHFDRLGQNLEDLAQQDLLSHLPIAVLGKVTEAQRLKFPKLDLHASPDITVDRITSVGLDQAIKRAMGYLQIPTVLLFSPALSDPLAQSLHQSLHQYLLLAGLQVQLADDPEKVAQQLETRNINALLITLHERSHSESANHSWVKLLTKTLVGLNSAHFPIIIIDGRVEDNSEPEALKHLRQMATVVLAQDRAIADLLPTLKQLINDRYF